MTSPKSKGVLLFFLLVSLVLCMNDTDAVINRGLFPLGENTQMELLDEHVVVTLTKAGYSIVRDYTILNPGNEGVFQFGSIVKMNTLNIDKKEVGVVESGGTTVQVVLDTSYLADTGVDVKVIPKEISKIEECIKHNDGNVCGQIWYSLSLHFMENEEKTIRLSYIIPIDESQFRYELPKLMYLYTEKFWGNRIIPRIELKLGIEGFNSPLDLFTPTGKYAKHSTNPTAREGIYAVWVIEDYEPQKKKYSYSKKLIHPFSLNHEEIIDTYLWISTKE